MEHLSEKRFPVNAKDYKLYEEVGEGVSAIVYRALCIPLNEIVAIKVLDLEKCNSDLDVIRREVHTMTLTDHPNLLRAHCSFTTGQDLWVVMPYMAGGSCLHIMKSAYPDGFEEPVIATLLREVLKALVYLHAHGHIHRDVKAGNILIDTNGSVSLADYGVSASMFDTGDRQRSRNTFVGTPCWMAPEVMQQLHGYDFKADIWSFGITSLELAHGHAPFSKYPPMKVLLMTLQNAPPGLDYERDKRFSKSFKEMVATCLVKDPKKRPTSEKLLKHPFFKHARPNDYLIRTILDGLSPLGDRFRTLKVKESEFLVQNKAQYGDKDHLSQQEYMRGISAWNFNIEDLKNQAALIEDYDDVSATEDSVLSGKLLNRCKNDALSAENMSPESCSHSNALLRQEDEVSDLHDLDNSFASFPIKPLQALKGYFDVSEEDTKGGSPDWKDAVQSSPSADQEGGRNKGVNMGRSSSLPHHVIPEHNYFLSGSLLQEKAPSLKGIDDEDRDCSQQRNQPKRNYSGPLFHQRRDSSNLSSVDETTAGEVVQRKGRFQVTSAELSPKGPNIGSSTSPTVPSLSTASIFPSLQCILQQNTIQRDEIIKLMKYVEQTCGMHTEYPKAGSSDLSQKQHFDNICTEMSPASCREKELQSQVIHLQNSIGSLSEELQTQKMRNAQLERQLNASVSRA